MESLVGVEQKGHQRPFLARRLAGSVEERRRVEAAERQGIAPSKLDGREPVATTRYFRDRHGRVTRSVTTREPEYTDQDRQELLALAEYRDSLCPCGCGHPLADTTSHEDTGPMFEVAPPRRCRARDALVLEQESRTNTPRPSALLWRTIRR